MFFDNLYLNEDYISEVYFHLAFRFQLGEVLIFL